MKISRIFWILLAVAVFSPLALASADSPKGIVESVLYIRVDFADAPGEPVSAQAVQDTFKAVNAFYESESAGKMAFKPTITPVLRMPKTQAAYSDGDDWPSTWPIMLKTARSLARAAGYEHDKYDQDIVVCRRSDVPLTSSVEDLRSTYGVRTGVKGIVLSNNFSAHLTAHTLAHVLGATENGMWESESQNPIGAIHAYSLPDDPWDWMRDTSSLTNAHFTVYIKRKFLWMPPSSVYEVKGNEGIYRLYAEDSSGLWRVRALSVAGGKFHDYWIEFRHDPKNVLTKTGALIYWSRPDYPVPLLLDMTPGTPEKGADAPLQIGRTFSDFAAGIHITPIAKDEESSAWIDVVVNRGQFGENQAPTMKIEADKLAVEQGQPVKFVSKAYDPDGDKLTYNWDFGDKTSAYAVSQTSKKWAAARSYRVRCTVTDMKGGTASASLVLSVKPSKPEKQRYAISGKVTCKGHPVQNVLVTANEIHRGLTDSNGKFTLLNLPAGQYEMAAQKDDYEIAVAGPSEDTVKLGAVPRAVDFNAISLEDVRPQVVVSNPLNGANVEDLSSIRGTVDDNPNGSGIEDVLVFIQNDGKFWNGRSWDKQRASVSAVINGRTWTCSTTLAQKDLAPGNYTVSAVAHDLAGNESVLPPVDFRSGVKLDGIDGYIQLESLKGLSAGNPPHTVEAWMQIDRKVTQQPWLLLLGNPGDGAHYWLTTTDGRGKFGTWGGGEPTFGMTHGSWNHFASVSDGSTVLIYVNGVLAGSANTTFNLQGIPFTVGKAYLQLGYLGGTVSDVRIWDKARSAAEVKADMNSEPADSEKNLICHWRLNEGKGKIANDSSGHGNDGSLVGGTSWLQANQVVISVVPKKEG